MRINNLRLGSPFSLPVLVLIASVTMSMAAASATVSQVNQALESAMTSSPEVKASWYEFRTAVEQQRATQSDYYPRLDLESTIGRETASSSRLASSSYNPDSSRLVLTQMLFDGFATRSEVARYGYLKLASYYDFKSTSEKVAAQVIEAYLNVARYRKLVQLAEQNYVQHRLLREDIEDRVVSGIGRRVDLEQATGRLALAESNLLTEMSNLHDITVGFQRLVGAEPASKLALVELPKSMVPESRVAALEAAFRSNPELSAMVERLKASRADRKGQDSAMMPKLDLRLRQQLDHNTSGVNGRYEEKAVELVMSYNLYRGGKDSANQRQAHERYNQVFELREQVCRNVKQEVVIAHNEIVSQRQQVAYLKLNRRSIGAARKAYRKQFDIGQRTLLDLLDTENEFFEVSRRYVKAEVDLQLASVKALAGMGQLLNAFSVDDLSKGQTAALDLNVQSIDDVYRCPAEAPLQIEIDTEALMARYAGRTNGPKLTDGKLVFNLNAQFEYQSTDIKPGYYTDLDEAASFMLRHPRVAGAVEGHTDSAGSTVYNQRLSLQRAVAVRQYLMDHYGIAGHRLSAVGVGELKPIASNDTDEGMARNRRVELLLEVEPPKRRPRLSDY